MRLANKLIVTVMTSLFVMSGCAPQHDPTVSSGTSSTPPTRPSPLPTVQPPPSLDEQAMKIGKDTFESLWIQCGDSYYTRDTANLGQLTQWRNVSFTLQLDALDDVARMNGMEWSGQVAIKSSYRRNGENQKWGYWEGGGDGLVFVKKRKTGWEARFYDRNAANDQQFKKPTCGEITQVRENQ